MSDKPNSNFTSLVACGSLAVNIFLLAFMLGHNNPPPPPPPPPPPHEAMMHPPGGPGGPGGPGMMPPPGETGMFPPPPGGPGMPPPPPGGPGHHFIAPALLFSPQEMDEDKPFMDAHFNKIHELRDDLATQLEKGSVTADTINDHFKQVDAIMDEIKQHLHQKMTDKIEKMTPEERADFAKKLREAPKN